MSRKSAEGNGKAGGFQLRKTAPAEDAEAGVVETPVAETSADLDQLGDLPHSYGTDTIFLVAQEPHWLFTYWDIDIARHPGGQTFLRVYVGEESIEAEIEVPFETRNWYIPVKVAGASYTVEIGYYRGSVWNLIARSVTIQTPPDRISDSENFDYATIPLHLSFQKLMENIQTAIRSGETLIQALARLQKDGKLMAFGQGVTPDFSTDQRVVLEALLGKDLIDNLSSGAFSSEEIEGRIRQHLEEKLSSGNASELLAKGQWGAEESSLFSALGAISSAGGVNSSWGTAALSSWAAAALTSWAAAAQGPSSWGAESVSSWPAQASWSAAALSSWLQAAETSWLQAAQSSWSQAALSSWNEAAVTSWSQAAVTSWSGGGSESLSSFGQHQPREFFMHVNAEVIFYGGTDPRAKVTIDGKPITLNPDGTFRYHFIFPDGTYEIPIVATSPDGVETRSAILNFHRGTEKQGKVDNTAQPPLAAPIGASS
jgi:hypothetical protein